MIYLLNKQH